MIQGMKVSLVLSLCGVLFGCDSEQINRPKAETRSMIIGGVPVHERDYKLPTSSQQIAQQKTAQ